jgi:hypothetical protein
MKTLHLIIVLTLVSIGFFFGASMFLPFPYGLVIGIAFPIVMMYYSIRNPEKEKILDVFLGSRMSHYIKMIPREKKIRYTIMAIFIFGFASSVLYPFVNDLLGIPTIYKTSSEEGAFLESYANPSDKNLHTFLDGVLYRSGLLVLFVVFPIYLVPPAMLTMPRSIFWILSIISIFILMHYSRGLSNKRRFAYTYFVTVQIASMWAPFFVWHPVFSHVIMPGV